MVFLYDVPEQQLVDIQKFIDPLQIDIELEGNRVDKGNVIVGATAGPERCLTHVLHEVGHFIEIDDKRMNKPGWGLRYGKWTDNPLPGPYAPSGWYEMLTDQHVQREIRVWAYQANLLRHFRLPVDFQDLAEAAVYLPDLWTYLPGKTDKERVLAVARDIETKAASVAFSFESIFAEMQRKRSKLTVKRKIK